MMAIKESRHPTVAPAQVATCFFGFGAEVVPGRRLAVQRLDHGDAPVGGVDSEGSRGVAPPVDGISATKKAEATFPQPWGD